MQYEAMVQTLGWAAGHEVPVRIDVEGGGSLVGVPTSVDPHPAALEVYLHPLGDETTEIAVSLAAIRSVQLAVSG
ncbi:MAG TPA: hypothetical protein VFO95_16010 [Gemmatimonadales bacterium]|jgi:hypothetical protein|nr:hypothetical protein [Gemmatimonadales bacterium]